MCEAIGCSRYWQKMNRRNWTAVIALILGLILTGATFAILYLTIPLERPVACGNVSDINYPKVVENPLWVTVLLPVISGLMTTIGLAVDTWLRSSRVQPKGNTPSDTTCTFFALFLMGGVLTSFISVVTGYANGYLAPNFLAVCQPNMKMWKAMCATTGSFVLPRCTTANQWLTNIARSTCPSTFVAFWAFMLMTIVVWAQSRKFSNTRWASIFARLAVQFVAVGLAAGSALVIHILNEGDWIAVSVGLGLGSFISWFIFGFLTDPELIGWTNDDVKDPSVPLNRADAGLPPRTIV